ncbi:MAG: PHP domain-containing protein [Clostridia bacterium]|nr:PHP domain-containing protein [Clostridia bacterium]
MIDCHVHIERGEYNINWIMEFVKHAIEREVSEIYLLEHSHRFIEFKQIYQSIYDYNEYQNQWLNRKMSIPINEYIELIQKIRKMKLPIKVKFGLEVCYIQGTEDIVKNIIDCFKWDFVTGSVHWIDGWGFDHKKEHWEDKNVDLVYKRYYSIMANLIKSKLFDIVAHPDSIKCFGYFPSFDLTGIYQNIAKLLHYHNVYAEQSAGLHLNYGLVEIGLNQNLYKIFKENDVKLITASDAHKPEDVGKCLAELKV